MRRVECAGTSEGGDPRGVEVRSIGIDDYSAVRYVHGTAFKSIGLSFLDEAELNPLLAPFESIEYTESLMSEDLVGAWIGSELVGTAVWLAADDTGRSARITSVYVRPMFTRLGVGRMLVREDETRARRHGYRSFSARATPITAGFYQKLGYAVTSHGSIPVDKERGLPLTFLRRHDAAVVEQGLEHSAPAARPGARTLPKGSRSVANVVDIMTAAASKTPPLPKFADQ
ncbi:MAG TPA: GNAT family N-acetyltransferase [Hyphomicrobiaceae bacterium]|nr:GNAT family N-acetyltransferase [Hyphomicrobiaceae bacterium]